MNIQIYEFSGIFVSRIRNHTGSEGTCNSGRLPRLQLLWLGAASKCFVNCQPWAVTTVSEKPVLLSHPSFWQVFLHLQPLPSLTSTASFQLKKRGNLSLPWRLPESSYVILQVAELHTMLRVRLYLPGAVWDDPFLCSAGCAGPEVPQGVVNLLNDQACCWLEFNLLSTVAPRFLSLGQLSDLIPPCSVWVAGVGLSHIQNQVLAADKIHTVGDCRVCYCLEFALQSLFTPEESPPPPNLVSSAKILNMHLTPVSWSFIEIPKGTAPAKKPLEFDWNPAASLT